MVYHYGSLAISDPEVYVHSSFRFLVINKIITF